MEAEVEDFDFQEQIFVDQLKKEVVQQPHYVPSKVDAYKIDQHWR